MNNNLHLSFGALYRLLEQPVAAQRTVIGLLAVHTCLLAYSAHVHSPTLNEPGHLVAGLSHWKFGRFEVYRVNPPLVKMVAALPVIAVGYEEDWSAFYEGPGARPEMAMGEDFVAANGERSYFLFMIARWACIPLSWIGAITCYLWARDLYGRPSGIMACAIWCSEPNILAHGSLMTPDIGGTALGVAACYTFWKWLKKPTWGQAALTGVVLGLTELCKTTLILFYPLWPVLWVIYRWPSRMNMTSRDWLREAGMLALRMVIGLYIVNLGYGFEGTGKQLKEFHFVSDLFSGRATKNDGVVLDNEPTSPAELNPQEPTNRFSTTWFGYIPMPFPSNYLLGIDIQQKDFENFGQPSYLRGQFQDQGWWYYYLYALMIKVPLGIWLLASMIVFTGRGLSGRELGWTDRLVLLTPPVIIFVIVSLKSGFNHHMRYVLPCFPFLVVWMSQSVLALQKLDNCTDDNDEKVSILPWPVATKVLIPHITMILLIWSVASSLNVYPHSLSYFNELVGGPQGGADHLLHSNIDWGQDLQYLGRWIKSNRDMTADEPVYLAYYGYCNPADLGFEQTLPWPPVADKSSDNLTRPSNKMSRGFYAISTNLLHGFPWRSRDGAAGDGSIDQTLINELRTIQPLGHAGYSISIYRIK